MLVCLPQAPNCIRCRRCHSILPGYKMKQYIFRFICKRNILFHRFCTVSQLYSCIAVSKAREFLYTYLPVFTHQDCFSLQRRKLIVDTRYTLGYTVIGSHRGFRCGRCTRAIGIGGLWGFHIFISAFADKRCNNIQRFLFCIWHCLNNVIRSIAVLFFIQHSICRLHLTVFICNICSGASCRSDCIRIFQCILNFCYVLRICHRLV